MTLFKIMGFTTLLILAMAWEPVRASFWVDGKKLQGQGPLTRELQLREFHQAFKPGYDGFIGAGLIWLPIPGQSQYQSPYGFHEGFAFRHRVAILVQDSIPSLKMHGGLAWWGERHGFDHEDFLLSPEYGMLGLVRSVHTFATVLSSKSGNWDGAIGIQWSHPEYVGRFGFPENDSLRYFIEGDWSALGIQAVLKGLKWQSIRLNAELADRALRGGDSTGIKTYMPDVEFYVTSNGEDPIRLTWRQNLYAQQVYLQMRSWPIMNEKWEATLQLYAHPSQMVGMEIGAQRLESGKWLFGVGAELPFLRVAYNLPRDYEGFFTSQGTVIIEFQIALGSRKNVDFFGLNAAQGAPMETQSKNRPASVGAAERSRKDK